MKTNFSRFAGMVLCAAVFASVTTPSSAGSGVLVAVARAFPRGILVTVSHMNTDGTEVVVTQGSTDENGQFALHNLPAGSYAIDVDGPSMVTAIDKLAPPPKEEKSRGGGLSLGIGGGMFGGGGSRRPSSGGKQGAGPVQGGASGGHGSSRADGGFESEPGVGMNIPIGGGNPNESPKPNLEIIFGIGGHGDRTADAGKSETGKSNAGVYDWNLGSNWMSINMPYCRDGAGQGMRIHVTVPAGPADNDTQGWYLGMGISY